MCDDDLVAAFVETFPKLDDTIWYTHESPPPMGMDRGIDPEDWNRLRWSPASIATDRKHLRSITEHLRLPLPRLYEQLVLNYRWPEVDLHRIRLKANLPGVALDGLARGLFADPAFEGPLIAEHYLPFAFGAEGLEHSYDPVCFDLKSLNSRGDCPILRFEHDAILSFGKIGEFRQLWPSLESWMTETIGAVG